MCDRRCGLRGSKIKAHYLQCHEIEVSVSSTDLTPSSSLENPPHLAPPLPSNQDFDMEDAVSGHRDSLSQKSPAFVPGTREDSPCPGPEDDDEWEMRSVFSDSSAESLFDGDEDDVVPPSFNLSPASIDPLSGYDEPCQDIADSEPKSNADIPSPLVGVYGSHGEHPYLHLLHRSVDLSEHRALL